MTRPPRILKRLRVDERADRAALIAALRARRASISPKYFYDQAGCALFAAICELPEYYPTRTEQAIFAAHRAEIAAVIGKGAQFVDLGAGDCRKAASWFSALQPARYFAIDIAAEEISAALAALAPAHPRVELTGIVADFTHGLDIDGDLDDGPVAFFYPGSSIGNFSPDAALVFVGGIARHCATRPGSGLLIGVDMQKDAARLVAAYDDAQGVTAAFNRNVLHHVNRIAGADFDPAQFIHRANYDDAAARIDMALESARAQAVTIDGVPRAFAAGELIHTEDSYKYTPEGFGDLLRRAGFSRVRLWQDAAGDFGVFYAS